MWGCAHATVYLWRSEDNLWESVLSFYHMGPRYGIQVGRLGSSKYLYLPRIGGWLRPYFVLFCFEGEGWFSFSHGSETGRVLAWICIVADGRNFGFCGARRKLQDQRQP